MGISNLVSKTDSSDSEFKTVDSGLETKNRKPEQKTDDWKLREECGIVAVFSKKGKNVAPYIYRALMALQHRGQDAAGFTIYNAQNAKLETRKGLGLVTEVFRPSDITGAIGSTGIGHTRYPTSGYIETVDVQPFVYKNIAIAHNGHIANHDVLKKNMEGKKYRYKSTVDSETMAFMIDEKLSGGIEAAVKSIMQSVDGAYSNVAIVDGKLTVFRDPHGIRPLVYGENDELICFASETAALDINGIAHTGDVQGGELATVENGKIKIGKISKKQQYHCMFEYVYFSRPDSKINGLSVYGSRKRLGEELAKEHPATADVVIPIPDTSRTAAEVYSRVSGIPMEEGLIKNRYVGRTFIMPDQEKRSDAVRLKLNAIKEVIEGRRVVLIDDSIVRGTTLREIVKIVKEAGAKEVHVRITCPPIRAPCFYGVNMSTYKELIANNKNIDEIKKFLGVDSLGYLSIDGLKRAIGLSICTGCLNEDYKTEYAKKLAKEKKDNDLRCG